MILILHGFKWLDVLDNRFTIKSDNLDERLIIYQATPVQGAEVLEALVEEIFVLIEVYMLEIDLV